jgi:malate dehydrogenase (oxaloacetate-decarboxylating)(NADP+)
LSIIIENFYQIEEIAPLVYTPTVGVVCQQFGHRFNRSRGMYFSLEDRGKFSTMVYNWPHDGEMFHRKNCDMLVQLFCWLSDVHVIVVTDGSRILGLVSVFRCVLFNS